MDVFKITMRDVWMASLNLTDAFFTIPVNEAYQKYFMLEYLGKIYKFICLLKTTRLYVDTKQECFQNIQGTVSLL